MRAILVSVDALIVPRGAGRRQIWSMAARILEENVSMEKPSVDAAGGPMQQALSNSPF
jgi:hypothetical protein